MVARNALSTAPPYPVAAALLRLGADLRTARLRRNLTLGEAAAKIGAGRRAVADAERGKPTTAAATYAALLWLYGLVEELADVADPERDEEGAMLARSQGRERARASRELDDDF